MSIRSRCLPRLPDTRSTRMTVAARSAAHRPRDWTHGRRAAALALGPSRPYGSPRPPPGLRDVSWRPVRPVHGRLAGPGRGARPAARQPRGHCRRPVPRASPARSPPDLNGGHQAGPARRLQPTEPRAEGTALTHAPGPPGRPPIRKDRPIAQPIGGRLPSLTAYVTNGRLNNRPRLAPGRRTGTAPSLTTAEPTNSRPSPSIAAFRLAPEPWGGGGGRPSGRCPPARLGGRGSRGWSPAASESDPAGRPSRGRPRCPSWSVGMNAGPGGEGKAQLFVQRSGGSHRTLGGVAGEEDLKNET